jgi:tetratricopeptide (TPR) repeat protein
MHNFHTQFFYPALKRLFWGCPRLAFFLFLLGLEKGNWAYKFGKKIVTKYQDNSGFLVFMAELAINETENIEEAERYLSMAVPNLTEGSNSFYHRVRGELFNRKEQYEYAVQEFEKAVEKEPGFGVQCEFATALSYNCDDRALAAWNKINKERPDYADAYYYLGLEYIRQDNFEKAYKLFQKSLELEPEDERYLFELGHVLHATADYENAIKYYEKSIARNCVNQGVAYAAMADCYTKMGQNEKAMDFAKKATEIDGKSEYCKEVLGHCNKTIKRKK